MIEYILVEVPKYGWLCTIQKDGREIYRGEHKQWAGLALEYAMEWMEECNG